MEFSSFDDQFVAQFDAHDEQHYLICFHIHIVQHAETLDTKFKLSEGVWPELADALCDRRWLVG